MTALRLAAVSGMAITLGGCYLDAGGLQMWARLGPGIRFLLVVGTALLVAVTHVPPRLAKRVPWWGQVGGVAVTAACCVAGGGAGAIAAASVDGWLPAAAMAIGGALTGTALTWDLVATWPLRLSPPA